MVQDPLHTKTMLKEAEIIPENADLYTLSEITDILEVDAVITGTFSTTKPVSSLLRAVIKTGGQEDFLLTGEEKATLNLAIVNGADGDTLVNYRSIVIGLGSSQPTEPHDLVYGMMKKACKKTSYLK